MRLILREFAGRDRGAYTNTPTKGTWRSRFWKLRLFVQTREVVEAMEKDAHISLALLRLDGGLCLMTVDAIPADILQPRSSAAGDSGTTALGRRLCAGWRWLFPALEKLRANWQ